MTRLLLLLSLAATGCAGSLERAKPVVASVNQAAAFLCQTAPAAIRQAEARGISVEELCSIHDVLSPFIEEATRAQGRASARAGRAMEVR